jgi:hypothetical protein
MRAVADEVADQRRADETRSTCDQNAHFSHPVLRFTLAKAGHKRRD